MFAVVLQAKVCVIIVCIERSPASGVEREGLVEDERQQHLRLRAHLQRRRVGGQVQRRVGALQAHAAELARLALALVDVQLAVLT